MRIRPGGLAVVGLFSLVILLGLTGAGSSIHAFDDQPERESWLDARQVLETRCLECHGGDHRKSGLSFATGETFAQGGHRGLEFDAVNPESSRLLHVIGYADPELAMPPDGQLKSDEIEILRAWILAGAPWPGGPVGRLADPAAHARAERAEAPSGSDWWAYGPLVAPEIPSVSDPAWAAYTLDALILNGIERIDLEPAETASPETLLRRATFDLTGLPPTPEEQDRFSRAYESDPASAWSTLIDRLLESEAYGEHWARHWLDQVRYAETNGYERDAAKTNIWRYRDWVIRSLNEDMPFDLFLIQQLAGDELAEFAPELAEDESALIATGYYRLGVWDDEPSDPLQARADELADIVDTTSQVFMGMTMGCARCHDHKADPITQRDYFAMTAFFNNITGYGGDGFGQHLGGGMTRPVADAPALGQLAVRDRDGQVAAARAELEPLTDHLGDQVETSEYESILTDARSGQTDWFYLAGAPPEGWMLQGFDDAAWARGRAGFGADGTPGAIIGTAWTDEQLTIRTRFVLTRVPDGAILSIHHDDAAEVYINGVQVAALKGYGVGYKDVQLGQEALNALVVGSNTIAIRCHQTGGGQYIDAGLRTGWMTDLDSWLVRLELGAAELQQYEDFADARRLALEIKRLGEAPVAEAYPALVVSERGITPPEQRVHIRGIVHAPGEVVEPAIPGVLAWTGAAALPELREDMSSTGRRLALARWLVGEGSFVTARVMANRLWQFHFGRGLCRSSGDFGRFGQLPTHPELLDHLAIELIERDWSLKEMHRYIMLSRTYQMSSEGSEEALSKDPRNNVYSHVDPRRLSAEQFRDSVLAVSGLASQAMYGPSVYPPLPKEVLASASRPNQAWGDSSEKDASRRSVYVFSKRSLRPPMLVGLDQPDPDRPCPVRFLTNVPTQALMTVNGDFTNNAAAAFAQRLTREEGSLQDRVDLGVILALGRPAGVQETARHLAFIDTLRSDLGLSEAEALRVYCLMLMNLNEFMWVD